MNLIPAAKPVSLGKTLATKRRHLGWTVRYVSEQSKIRPEYIESLEMDDFHKFSSDVHLKGFIKIYAGMLGLDPEHAIAMYRRQAVAVPKQPMKAVAERSTIYLDKLKPWLLAATAFCLIALFIGVQIHNLLQPPLLEITLPAAASAGSTIELTASGNEIEITGRTQNNALLRMNQDIIRQTPAGDFTTGKLLLSQASTRLMFTATSQFGVRSQLEVLVTKLPPTLLPAGPAAN